MAASNVPLCIKAICQSNGVQAVVVCTTCSNTSQGFFMCENCYEVHTNNAVNSDHTICRVCSDHPASTGLNYYCKTCKVVICTLCHLNDHGKCKVTNVTALGNDCANNLYIGNTETLADNCDKFLKDGVPRAISNVKNSGVADIPAHFGTTLIRSTKAKILPSRDIWPEELEEKSGLTDKCTVERIPRTEGTIYEAVAHLVITFLNRGKKRAYTGTGFLVKEGRSYWLVTAAHNVAETSAVGHTKADTVEIYFGRNNEEDTPFKRLCFSGHDFEIPKDFQKAIDMHDIARLNLNNFQCQLPTYYFMVASSEQTNTINKQKIAITGYPAYPKNPRLRREGEPGYPLYSMWTSSGDDARPTFHHIYYKESTSTGNSGSPVYFQECKSSQFYVAGVHVGYDNRNKANMAVMITTLFPDAKSSCEPADPVYTGKVTSTLTSCKSEQSILVDITYLPDGRLVVADRGTRQLSCVAESGAVTWRWKPNDGRTVLRVEYIACADRLMVITEAYRPGVKTITWQERDSQLHCMSLQGELQQRVGEHIKRPIDLAAGEGKTYVCCDTDQRVYVLDPDGQELRRFDVGAQFTHMTYLPGSDTLVLGRWSTHRLHAISSRGEPRWRYGGEDSGPGQVNRPCGMCAAPDGVSLLVADMKNRRVQLISSDGRYIQDVVREKDNMEYPVALTVNRDKLCVAEGYGAVKIVSLI